MKKIFLMLVFAALAWLVFGCDTVETDTNPMHEVKYIAEDYNSIVYVDPITGVVKTSTGSGAPVPYTFTFQNVPTGTYLDLSVIHTGYSATATIKVDGIIKVTQTKIGVAHVTYTTPETPNR